MTKLKHKEIAVWRTKLLELQNNLCPLCNTVILPDQSSLDHCHKSGHIRMVLHRSCNGVEGRISRFLRMQPCGDREVFLLNLIEYWKTNAMGVFEMNPIHPTHKIKTKKTRRITK